MATFIDAEGSIFDSGADVLVCPVNCVPGVMGAGLALEFAKRWPHLVSSHRFAVREGFLRPGKVHSVGFKVTVWNGREFVQRGPAGACLFFPTKDRWRNSSRIEYIRDGLACLARKLDPGRSVAIPALGCGLGGLDWRDVRPLIVEALAPLDITVMLYAPKEGV